ncbi:MvhG1: methyl-viologen-reducing hydrogenase, gamma subunit [Desulfosarcina variabilis str. Montpellier]|uniref:NADH-quinone oxidoreductase subunit B family protein n=1 Tax=Desulfosarcina variabilis TaxID=2300 RepID=UPI003AFA4DA2
MAGPPTIALYWCAGCGGCEESVFDMAEQLLDVYEKTRIVFWPAALDARSSDVEALADGEIDAAFINGAIRLDEHVQMVRLLRKKSKCLIAHGTCAHMGGVIGLGNFFSSKQLLACAYQHAPSMATPKGPLPGQGADTGTTRHPLPGLLPAVLPLDRIVCVEAVIPGCPPPPETMAQVFDQIIAGVLPAKGTVYAHQKALCHSCPRRDTRPERITVSRFKRLQDTLWDPTVCFLAQDLICLGPVTRGGCNARCISANMPCRGCFGPTTAMDDFGAGAMALIAALMADGDETDYEALIESIPDPGGLFYRYSLAASILGKGRRP